MPAAPPVSDSINNLESVLETVSTVALLLRLHRLFYLLLPPGCHQRLRHGFSINYYVASPFEERGVALRDVNAADETFSACAICVTSIEYCPFDAESPIVAESTSDGLTAVLLEVKVQPYDYSQYHLRDCYHLCNCLMSIKRC